MDKVDFKKALKPLYGPTRRQGIHLVEVPALRFFMIDGQGDPNTEPGYAEAVTALYSVSYALKFTSRGQLDKDYGVPPLEGLWWAKDLSAFLAREKHLWFWTMMIMIPDWIGPRIVDQVIEKVRREKPQPGLDRLRIEQFTEGAAVQALHIGPYDGEGPLIAEMHAYAKDNGKRLIGKHHEIYLSDPRRAAPEKLRTILRQPIQ